ncbi:MAG TPA: hypothetical protein VLB69_08470, partial [Rudaea sp.]|nr:hypothetical protein [Rudaea sp.]
HCVTAARAARHLAFRRNLTSVCVCLPAGRDTLCDGRAAASFSFSPSVPDRGCCLAAVAVSFNPISGKFE